LGTKVEVDAKMTLEKVPINGEHIHVQACKFKFFKGLLLEPCYNKQCWKGASKNLGQRMSIGGAITQKVAYKYIKQAYMGCATGITTC